MDSFKDNFYFQKRGGKSQKLVNLNIVPVLDMMTLIIFFLVSTAVFLEFTKQTVPPSATHTITSPERPPPLAPRLMVFSEPTQYRLIMRWNGETAGQIEKFVPKTTDAVVKAATTEEDKEKLMDAERAETFKTTTALMGEFLQKFPAERTYQLSMAGSVGYQQMISTMDAMHFGVLALEKATNKTPAEPVNVVLTGYAETDAEFDKNYKEDGTTATTPAKTPAKK